MQHLTRCAAPHLLVVAILALTAGVSGADTQWPSLFRYTVSLSSDDTARYQVSAGFSGPIADYMSAKIEGWWIGGTEDNTSFVGDACVDFGHAPLYLAAGRKYTMFGPAGILVSPGLFGGELGVDINRWQLQAIAGTIAFTPGTGTTRFTHAGPRASSDESMTALRLAVPLTRHDARAPVVLAGSWLDVLDDTGTSLDLQIEALSWLTLFGEAADFGDEDAHVYGIRLSDAHLRDDGKAWILVFYNRDIPVGYVPAQAGACAYFEGQDGWVGAFYYQMNSQQAIGVYADNEDAIFTWFHSIPL
jgi:hypothetical protein